jgi:hypothetical protein
VLEDGNLPKLSKLHIITLEMNKINWPLYSHSLADDEPKLSTARAAPVAFSPDCQYLRIGSQLFELDAYTSTYEPLFLPPIQSHPFPSYIEEFAHGNGITVTAARRRVTQDHIYQRGVAGKAVNNFGADFCSMLGRHQKDELDSSAECFIQDEEDDSSSDDSWSEEDEGNESFSEADTVDSDDHEFQDDLSIQGESDSDMSESSSSDDSDVPYFSPSDDSSEDSEDEAQEIDGETAEASEDGDNESDGGLKLTDIDDYAVAEEEDEEYAYGVDENGLRYALWERMQSPPKATLEIRVAGAKPPFRITREIPLPLYASPPVIHPFKPLVVWPIGSGDIIFADYDNRTYFVRRIRTSTTFSALFRVFFPILSF